MPGGVPPLGFLLRTHKNNCIWGVFVRREVTIYDIAKIADVSPSTVSRVINNRPNVKEATRKRIMSLLEQYDYTPNETARSLVTQSSRMIGVLISDIRTTHHTDGIFYLQRALSEQGYSCLIYNTGMDSGEQTQYIQAIEQRKVDAAVLMGSIYQTRHMEQAICRYLPSTPVFICNGYLDLPNVYGILAGERDGVADCVKLLAGKGRRRTAFLVDRSTPSNLLKQAGYEEGVARWCGGVSPVVIHSGSSTQDVYQATRELLRAHPETDGVIYSEDLLAVVGIRALVEGGVRVPDDVAVIGINNSRYTELCTPTLTSLDNMLYDLSLTIADNVGSVLQGRHISKKVMIYSKIVERQST